MVRAPRFDKMGLKKGAWSPEEDQKLIAYIKRYRIWIWNQMPKAAGLARSGKSCRLRWMNYLRPGIKHGNFSKEEEETILKFHELLGNRWSEIAARLPGRTDNEVKNYWHTHLKRRLKDNLVPRTKSEAASNCATNEKKTFLLPNAPEASKLEGSRDILVSPQLSTGTNFSSSSIDPAVAIDEIMTVEGNIGSLEPFGGPQNLWTEPFSEENLYMEGDRATFADSEYVSPTSQMWIQEHMSTPFVSLEAFGELQSLFAKPFSVENLCMVEDWATFADAGYISPSQMRIEEQTNTPFGSSETVGDLQSLFAKPFSVENLCMAEDQTTIEEPGYIPPTSQTRIQEHMSPLGSLEEIGELQSLCATPLISVENFYTIEDLISPTFQMRIQQPTSPVGSYIDAGTDFWVDPFISTSRNGWNPLVPFRQF